MKTKLIPLFALLFIFFSCKDVEEIPPNVKIAGKYQSTIEGNMAWLGDKVNFVNTLVFRSDGTFSSEDYTTAIGSDQILGYRGYFSGTYTIVNERVTIYYNEWFTMGIEDINYVPKNNLRFEEGNYIVGYAIQKNYTQLSYICPEDPECKPESYIKIN